MESKSEFIKLMERITVALEKIAVSLQQKPQLSPEKDPEKKLIGPDLNNNDQTKLETFLSSKGISIKNIPPEQESDQVLDKIALFIGNKFGSVRMVLDAIKANMNFGKPFHLNLRNEPQKLIADITQLCTILHNVAFLTSYHYHKSPSFQLYATPSTSPRALNFFSGQWLERFVKTQVLALLMKRNLNFSYLCNVQISFPNGDDFEIDMLFETNGEVFWIEAKTGDYRRYLEKYSKMAKILGLNQNHSFLVLADNSISENLAKDLSSLFNITVVKIENFAEQLEKFLPENPHLEI